MASYLKSLALSFVRGACDLFARRQDAQTPGVSLEMLNAATSAGERSRESSWVAPGAMRTANSLVPELVKNAPAHLGAAFLLVEENQIIEAMFDRVRRYLYSAADRVRLGSASHDPLLPLVIRESGRTMSSQRYFFLQPISRSGWLFEQVEGGWIVTQAQKLAGQNTFLRSSIAWDVVSLHQRADDSNHQPPRVSSVRFGQDLLSFPVYERQLLQQLGLEDVA